MYTPKDYQQTDTDQIEEFIKKYSFASLISVNNTNPLLTHLPFIAEKKGEKLKLYTHLAKANPHSKFLSEQSVLIVFTGPQAYISSTWYTNKRNVSTWNYTAVHVSGIAHLMEGADEIATLLNKTVAYYENGNITHHQELPEEYKTAMAKEIVGIEIEIKNIEAKFKLSQNKPKEDIRSVIDHLKQDSTNIPLIDLMLKENKEKLK